MSIDQTYDSFTVGDSFSFHRTYTQQDLEKIKVFSAISTPLHHDPISSNAKIIPMHLIAAPLSTIADAVFPGHHWLCLNQEMRSHSHASYDIKLTYSTCIIAKNDLNNTLTLRVLVFSGHTIHLEATQQVQVREKQFTLGVENRELHLPVILPKNQRKVLLTGATGQIGRRIAMKFAKSNIPLILAVRTIDDRSTELLEKIQTYNGTADCIELDLNVLTPKKVKTAVGMFFGEIDTIIHAAAPPLTASLHEHMQVNFQALKVLSETFLENFLQRQNGKVMLIGSSVTLCHPDGIEEYTASKAAAANYLQGLSQKYSQWGISSQILTSGLVNTPFSQSLRAERQGLLPEQVAEEVYNLIQNATINHAWLEKSGVRYGDFNFNETRKQSYESLQNQATESPAHSLDKGIGLKQYLRNFFGAPPEIAIENAGINTIPGWDSMRHIELMLALERDYGIRFSSLDIDQTTSFASLTKLLKTKMND